MVRIGELLGPEGSVFRVEKALLPDGGFVLTYVDLSDLKDSERALEEKSISLEGVLQSTAHGISIFDSELKLIVANSGFLELYGFDPEFAEAGTPLEAYIRDRMVRGVFVEGESAERDLEEMISARLNVIKNLKPDVAQHFRDKMADGRTIQFAVCSRPLALISRLTPT